MEEGNGIIIVVYSDGSRLITVGNKSIKLTKEQSIWLGALLSNTPPINREISVT